MRFEYLALCLVLGTGCFCLVSAKNVDASAKVPLEAQPTAAPLMTSSPKPTVAPRLTTPPTRSMIHNVPPKKMMSDPLPMKATPIFMPEMMTEMQVKDAKPVQLQGIIPATQTRNEQALEAEKPGKKPVLNKKSPSKSKSTDNKAMQVTGFITKNGSIYEIEDAEGMGQIEGRQNPDDKDNKEETIVCNHGSVVIYSDVPCDQITNVQVGAVHQTIEGGAPDQNTTKKPQTNANGVANDDFFGENKPRRQNNNNRNGIRNNNNKRRRGNGNGNRNGNGNGVRNGNGNGNGNRNRNRRNKNRQGQGQGQQPVRSQQQRKKQQQQKLRRQQLQRQQQKRRQQQQLLQEQEEQEEQEYQEDQEEQQQKPQQQQEKRRRRPQQNQQQQQKQQQTNRNRRRNQNRNGNNKNNAQRPRDDQDEEWRALEYYQ